MFLHTSSLVRGVTSVLTCYLTSFWSTSLSTECDVFILFLLHFVFLHIFSFLFLVLFFLVQLFYEDFWFLPVHRYHLSLSVSIIYHKIFHISISFLYKITHSFFMHKVEISAEYSETIDFIKCFLL